MNSETISFRLLVVEDELLIAIELEDVLRALGCTVIGPVAKLVDAIELASTESLDAAILDVTIRGGQVFPVAEILLERDIPFVFASGYGDWALPENMRDRPRLTKPFTTAELEEQVKLLCAQAMKRKMR
ncbi:response regulator [Rhizobium binxianense]|uniref:response regulator n=1 Tax=Rhizobium binxianense TaxID=3024242 RepID=UPI0023A938EA|nr:response regulator [Rhizobium sp. MJ22]WEA26318.1 response regulator [Rhizobium sp. MJ22]